MDKKILESRIRQILAVDKNAFAVYSDLAESAQEEGLKARFSDIAKDERRHIAMGEEMLSLLEK